MNAVSLICSELHTSLKNSPLCLSVHKVSTLRPVAVCAKSVAGTNCPFLVMLLMVTVSSLVFELLYAGANP